MFDLIKDAVIERKVQGVRQDLRQLADSFSAFGGRLDDIKQMDPKVAWQMIHGLQAALQVAEKSLRMARQSEGLPDGPTRRVATDLQSTLAHMRELLERDVIPLAEKEFGFPPKGTRWKVIPPENE